VDIFQVFIVQPIFNLLIVIYSLIPGGDFGVALIIFTILVRLALSPLVKKQLHQTKAMQKMQPELARIKKESKGNKKLESMRMMELYKEHDIKPFSSIGILFIQLPIFIALFQVIQTFTLHRDKIEAMTYNFIKFLGPVQNLIAHPAGFNDKFLGFLNLSQTAIVSNPFAINISLLILAIISSIIQYVMTKQISPKKQSNKRFRDILNEAGQGKKTDKSEMNTLMMGSMTKFLPIMMFFIMISLPGAVVLYFTVSNLYAVIQQHYLLKDDAEEMIEIADHEPAGQHKKATAKAREKEAIDATIVRIKAKDTAPWKSKSAKRRKEKL
jgi:YidC/Oxa1 family membrane protein insertase